MDDLLILGGGASGLSLGLLTEAPVMEAGGQLGGHSLSRTVDGYTFDRGPHIMFSRSKFLLGCMIDSLGDNVHQCVRNNKVAIQGRMVKYPIENDLGSLEQHSTADCLIDYVKSQMTGAHGRPNPTNLAEWFESVFGLALTELYFRPYNEKVWKTRLEDLSMVWAERIPMPPVEDVVKSALGIPTEGYVHQLYYHYPRSGGYAALMSAWASGIEPKRVHLSERVSRIETHKKQVRVTSTSGTREASGIVSTLPLVDLPSIVHGIPQKVVDAISRLRTNATVIVTMAFAGIDTNQWTAVYIADGDFLPNRVSFPAVFSPFNAPDGYFLIQSEIVVPHLSDIEHMSDESIVDHVYSGLMSRRLIPADVELVNTYVDRYELAYVVYTSGFERDLGLVKSWARSVGIHLHGRFGSHNYLNVDGCLEQSVTLSRELGFTSTDEEIAMLFRQIGLSNVSD